MALGTRRKGPDAAAKTGDPAPDVPANAPDLPTPAPPRAALFAGTRVADAEPEVVTDVADAASEEAASAHESMATVDAVTPPAVVDDAEADAVGSETDAVVAEAVVADAVVAEVPGVEHPEVVSLRESLVDLQGVVASLVARSDQVDHSAMHETDIASRIIVAANRAADATVEGARTEAQDLLADAKARSLEIINAAREIADRELTAERERVAAATEAWLAQRAEVLARLRSVDASLAAYRTDLAATSSSVEAALAEMATVEVPSVVVSAPPDDAAPVPATDVSDADPVAAVVTGEAIPATPPTGEQSTVAPELGAPVVTPGPPKRSNLFGGDAAACHASGGTSPPLPAPVARSIDGDDGPPRLRAGFFGR